MHAIFDHLTAILVGAGLLAALLFVQMRQQASAVETTVRNRVEMHSDEFLSVLQRDAENIRTRAQTQHAFGAYRFTIRRATGTDGETYTQQLSFPTLKDPALGGRSPLALVTYEMEPTGETVRVGTSQRPTYRMTRTEYTRADGMRETGGAVGLIDFDAILLNPDGSEVSEATTVGTTPSQVRLSATLAASGSVRRTGDQRAQSSQNATRRATTVRVIGAGAQGGLPPVQTGSAGIPELPGDPPPLQPSSTTLP